MVALVLLFWFIAAAAQAATIYVDVAPGADCTGNYSIANRTCTGSDGDSYDTPQEAATATSAGDTVLFRAGTYTQTMTASGEKYLNITTSGSSGSPITYMPYNNETVVLRCRDAATSTEYCFEDDDVSPVDGNADGPAFTNGEVINIAASWIVVDGFEVYGASRNGVVAVGNNNILRNLVSRSNWQLGVNIEGNNNLLQYVEVHHNRHASGVTFNPNSSDNTAEYIYTWQNGREDDGTQVLPILGDPDGGGNSDGLNWRNTCHNSAPPGENLCERNILRHIVSWKNVDDGLDLNGMHTLLEGAALLENGPEGGQGLKVQVLVEGPTHLVNVVTYKNTFRGIEHRQNSGDPSLFINITAIENTSAGIFLSQPANVALTNNLSLNNGGSDFQITGNCAATAGCITNWSEDGTGGTDLSGAVVLTNETLWQDGGALVFTIPGGLSIQQRVLWIEAQLAAAFLPVTAGLLNTGTPVTYPNPQTAENVSRSYQGAAPEIGAVELVEGFGQNVRGVSLTSGVSLP